MVPEEWKPPGDTGARRLNAVGEGTPGEAHLLTKRWWVQLTDGCSASRRKATRREERRRLQNRRRRQREKTRRARPETVKVERGGSNQKDPALAVAEP